MVIQSGIRNTGRDLANYTDQKTAELINSDYSRNDLARFVAHNSAVMSRLYMHASGEDKDNQILITNILDEFWGNVDETSPAFEKYIKPNIEG